MPCFKRRKCRFMSDKNIQCTKNATYGYTVNNIRLFCKLHKVGDVVDIVGVKCIICKKVQPSFNYPTEQFPRYCFDCMSPDMVDVRKRDLCIICNRTRASFNYNFDDIPKYCAEDALEGMQDIVSKRCKKCKLTQIKNKYKGYCVGCYKEEFNVQVTKNENIKEKYVYNIISTTFTDCIIVYNKTVKYNIYIYRPDIIIYCNNYIIIVEIDENQHKYYNKIIENERMINIQHTLEKQCIFIRFNPDSYKDESGKHITGCWKYINNNLVVNPKYIPHWEKRINTLKECIKNNMLNTPKDNLVVKYLFYNFN